MLSEGKQVLYKNALFLSALSCCNSLEYINGMSYAFEKYVHVYSSITSILLISIKIHIMPVADSIDFDIFLIVFLNINNCYHLITYIKSITTTHKLHHDMLFS